MIKKKLFLFGLIFAVISGAAFADEDDDWMYEEEDIPIVEDTETDISIDSVYLNPDAKPVNVSHFDIAGIMLGMSYEEIESLFFNNTALYAPRKKNSVVYTINNEWKYNLDYECRQNGISLPDKLEKCIYSLARNRGLLYASEVHLERTYTGETIDLYFTSNATNNVVWKIVYTNDSNSMDGDSEAFVNQRDKKLLIFWQGVLDKYGSPNSDEDKWISAENPYEPMMQAYLGQLELVDNGLNSKDSSENVQSARENFQAKPYAF